jgi:transcriptional regulator GlxA family with amidase domain
LAASISTPHPTPPPQGGREFCPLALRSGYIRGEDRCGRRPPFRGSRTPRRILILAFPQAKLLDVTAPCEVFADANHVLGRGGYEVDLVSAEPGPFETSSGVHLVAHHGYASACRPAQDVQGGAVRARRHLGATSAGERAVSRVSRAVRWLGRCDLRGVCFGHIARRAQVILRDLLRTDTPR